MRLILAALLVGGCSFGMGTHAGSTTTTGGGGGGTAADQAQFPPGQWSLAERTAWKNLQAELDGYIANMDKECGVQAKGTFVFESFRPFMKADNGDYGVDGYTRAHISVAPSALRDLCVAGDPGKSAVHAKLQQIVIEHGGGGQPSQRWEGGTLHVVIEPEAQNAAGASSAFTDWLKANL